MRNKGYDRATIDLILKAWRPSTKKNYSTYLRKWATFCVQRGINPLFPTLPQACRFLRILSDGGLGYAALNTARSALATILPDFDNRSFGTHPLVCWLVKGGYEKNPPRPRYTQFWNVNKIFDLFKVWGPKKNLSLKQLSLKVAVLTLLVSSQRGQTIVNLSLDGMELEKDKVVFKMKTLLKHNRLGDPLDTLILRAFQEVKRLCVVRTITEYILRTEDHRVSSQLLLSFVSPFGAISRDTLSRWTLKVMKEAGVDTQKYRGHSTRGASASAACRLGVPLNLILKHASWKCADSFARFYNKRLEDDTELVAQALLENV